MNTLAQIPLSDLVDSANTGLDAIKRAPIVSINTGVKCLRIQDISQDKNFDDWGFCEVNEKNYSNFRLKKNDIIIARTGETVGVNKIIKNDVNAVYNNGLIRLRVNTKIADPLFIYYTLQTKSFEGFIDSRARAISTQPNIRLESLLNYKIRNLPLANQTFIASILSAYDELIENNEKRIKILEEMAQRLYTEWFIKLKFPGYEKVKMVDSSLGKIPEGWEVLPFAQVVEVNPLTRVGTNQQIKHIPMEAISNSLSVINEDKVIYREQASGAKFINKDTLFARITPCLQNGKTAMVNFLEKNEVACGSTEFVVFRQKRLTPSYTYLLAREENFREAARLTMVGASGRQRVRSEFFESYKVIVPDPETLTKFEDIVFSNFQLVNHLHNIKSNLTKTRDLLIPQLVSGKREIKN